MIDVYTMQRVMVISEVQICDSKEGASERDISREKSLLFLPSFVHLRGTFFTQQLLSDIPLSPVLNLFPFQLGPLCSAVEMAKV